MPHQVSDVLILEPHNDDVALFCAFTAARERAHVVTVLRSCNQQELGMGITAEQREAENVQAMQALGCTWKQMPHPDCAPDWEKVKEALVDLDDECEPASIYVPAFEQGGNEQHNRISEIARSLFGDRIAYYLTYTGGPGRVAKKSTWGTEVVPEGPWVTAKLRALACYRSQIERGPRQHFMQDLREYVA